MDQIVRIVPADPIEDADKLSLTGSALRKMINEHIEREEGRLSQLKDRAESFRSSQAQVMKVREEVRNPISAFQVVSRLRKKWREMEKLIRNHSTADRFDEFAKEQIFQGAMIPRGPEASEAAEKLLRLQDFYRLPAKDLADGRIGPVRRQARMQALDCLDLGKEAMRRGDFHHSLQWLNEALERGGKERPSTCPLPDVLELLALALFKQGNVQRAMGAAGRLVEIAPGHPRAQRSFDQYLDAFVDWRNEHQHDGKLPPEVNPRPRVRDVSKEDYMALCRGERPKAHRDSLGDPAQLLCYLKRDAAFLSLAPLKVEVLRRNPDVLRFIRLVSEEEAEKLKKIAEPEMLPATVHNTTSGMNEEDRSRSSKSVFIDTSEDETVREVSERIGTASGLSLETSEQFQIASYNIGGEYQPHFDHSSGYDGGKEQQWPEEMGDRIATVLCYLEAPAGGGATVFPHLDLAVFPSQGDCVFWHNLLRSGSGDSRTLHGACPVLAGRKWVANQWLHERGQEAARPCGLHQNSA